MRAESWMNRTPAPPTPLQRARTDLNYWGDRMRSLTTDLVECERQWNEARERANDDPESERDECSLCAVIDAEDDLAVQKLVAEHYPDHEMRFCEQKPDNFTPGDRFPTVTAACQ